ncbi:MULTISPECIES: hypothetical protein [unclassified Prochlorococcus]|uniref:hypothetical protein n=1 Tax=unclassified Prochlorococcus TaxID=2627481 RepID=UPI0005338A57|nr:MULTISPECIES: hypothetical protein [unclassified Prochlorococcus]KGG27012.1 hypothetical protein EV12_1460 [Prochlorococcus sp. MIT 0701]KGG27910.1 hypothetical protein EV13_1803 [Prochlorococcus sp. MIT 0702]KGG31367.1 hypothetical protein EV14_2318 [Prochlorococcus sp. MIT 0703]
MKLSVVEISQCFGSSAAKARRRKPISEDRILFSTGVLASVAWSRQRKGNPWSKA